MGVFLCESLYLITKHNLVFCLQQIQIALRDDQGRKEVKTMCWKYLQYFGKKYNELSRSASEGKLDCFYMLCLNLAVNESNKHVVLFFIGGLA